MERKFYFWECLKAFAFTNIEKWSRQKGLLENIWFVRRRKKDAENAFHKILWKQQKSYNFTHRTLDPIAKLISSNISHLQYKRLCSNWLIWEKKWDSMINNIYPVWNISFSPTSEWFCKIGISHFRYIILEFIAINKICSSLYQIHRQIQLPFSSTYHNYKSSTAQPFAPFQLELFIIIILL